MKRYIHDRFRPISKISLLNFRLFRIDCNYGSIGQDEFYCFSWFVCNFCGETIEIIRYSEDEDSFMVKMKKEYPPTLFRYRSEFFSTSRLLWRNMCLLLRMGNESYTVTHIEFSLFFWKGYIYLHIHLFDAFAFIQTTRSSTAANWLCLYLCCPLLRIVYFCFSPVDWVSINIPNHSCLFHSLYWTSNHVYPSVSIQVRQGFQDFSLRRNELFSWWSETISSRHTVETSVTPFARWQCFYRQWCLYEQRFVSDYCSFSYLFLILALEYTVDSDLIPRNTSVIVIRRPRETLEPLTPTKNQEQAASWITHGPRLRQTTRSEATSLDSTSVRVISHSTQSRYT